MSQIEAAAYGILPGQEIGARLAQLTCALQTAEPGTRVVFAPGTYYIDSANCEKHTLYITNTVGDKEFRPGETPHINAVPFYLSGLKDITIDGGDSVFIINGKVTNAALEDCENITLCNLELRHAHPDMHGLRVIKKTPFTVDFAIDADTNYQVENGKLCFYGQDYRVITDHAATAAAWIGRIRKAAPQQIRRVAHPLLGYLKVRDLGQHRIRVTYPCTFRFLPGDQYYIFDVRRQFAGIFVNRCKNVALQNIRQRFNYSLALVAQDTKDLTACGLEFAPEPGSPRQMASVADFVQICMCRGQVSITDSTFDGAGDDCLNVHGIHFQITQQVGDRLTVRFMHPQSHGFNPLRVGDTLAYIDPETLLEQGRCQIQQSRLLNEYEIALTVSNTDGCRTGAVVEDMSACPDVTFANNTLTRIITRGLLITTRGHVRVQGNRFISTGMSGVLLSDDAKNWYESGMCQDVTLADNRFDFCGQTPVRILPENSRYAGAVHRHIQICNNRFDRYSGYCITAKATDDLTVTGNTFACGKPLRTKDCTQVHFAP